MRVRENKFTLLKSFQVQKSNDREIIEALRKTNKGWT